MRYEYVYDSKIYGSRKRRLFLRKVKKIFSFFLTFSLLLFLGIFFFTITQKEKNNSIISPVTNTFNVSIKAINNIIHPSKLHEVVEESLDGASGTYGISIKNLKTGESYNFNEKRKFSSASLYKLWVMAVVFSKIENGTLDGSKEINRDIADLNKKFDIASESAELHEGTFNMSIINAVNQMITISHNYAALSLTDEVGVSNVGKFLKNQGFGYSSIGSPPTTTAVDIMIFFEKLYAGQLAGPESTGKMLKTLKNQTINDRIPKYLPDSLEIAHKTGELDGFKHDAGIVFTEKGDYILVILSESKNPAGAAEREAKLSKAVFEYFESRK